MAESWDSGTRDTVKKIPLLKVLTAPNCDCSLCLPAVCVLTPLSLALDEGRSSRERGMGTTAERGLTAFVLDELYICLWVTAMEQYS